MLAIRGSNHEMRQRCCSSSHHEIQQWREQQRRRRRRQQRAEPVTRTKLLAELLQLAGVEVLDVDREVDCRTKSRGEGGRTA